jgi:DNA-binding response OmpR family regulator
MSGYAADVITHQGVLDEGVAFMQKPFATNELAKKIREVLDNSSSINKS